MVPAAAIVDSGVRYDRSGLNGCLRALRKGDVLVVWKLDRLGRNVAHQLNASPSSFTAARLG